MLQDYTASLVKADKDQLALSLKTSYAADMLKFTGTFTQGGKVSSFHHYCIVWDWLPAGALLLLLAAAAAAAPLSAALSLMDNAGMCKCAVLCHLNAPVIGS